MDCKWGSRPMQGEGGAVTDIFPFALIQLVLCSIPCYAVCDPVEHLMRVN